MSTINAGRFARSLTGLPARIVNSWISLAPALPGILHVERKYQRLEEAASPADVSDYLAELRFGLMFRVLGFEVEAEPLGQEGPDFRVVRDDLSAMLECIRLRPVYEGPPVLDLSDPDPSLREYGDVRRDTKKAHGKIEGKFRQVRDHAISFIAVWNDERELEEFEVRKAVGNLLISENPVPPGLRAVVYASESYETMTKKQVFCFELPPTAPIVTDWLEELRNLWVDGALDGLRVSTDSR